MVIYLSDNVKVTRRPLAWQIRGLQQTISGYGANLTTELVAHYNGRQYRVYCTRYGNAGSYWIKAGGNRLVLSDCHPVTKE